MEQPVRPLDRHRRRRSTGTPFTVGGQGFAAMSRKELLRILQERVRRARRHLHFRTEAPDLEELRTRLRPGARRRRPQLRRSAARYADVFRPTPGPAAQQVHLVRHRPGLRGVPVLRQADGVGHHADPRLPLLRRRARPSSSRCTRTSGAAPASTRTEDDGLPARRLRRVRRRADRGDLRRRAAAATRSSPTTPSG